MTTSKVGLTVSLSLAVLGLSWAVAQTSKKEPTGGTFTADYYNRHSAAVPAVRDHKADKRNARGDATRQI